MLIIHLRLDDLLIFDIIFFYQTFGNLHLRPNLGYGGISSGRGDTYHTSRGRGRGYGYRGRGRGYIGF